MSKTVELCKHDYERWHGEDFGRNYDILHCKKCFNDVVVEHMDESDV